MLLLSAYLLLLLIYSEIQNPFVVFFGGYDILQCKVFPEAGTQYDKTHYIPTWLNKNKYLIRHFIPHLGIADAKVRCGNKKAKQSLLLFKEVSIHFGKGTAFGIADWWVAADAPWFYVPPWAPHLFTRQGQSIHELKIATHDPTMGYKLSLTLRHVWILLRLAYVLWSTASSAGFS